MSDDNGANPTEGMSDASDDNLDSAEIPEDAFISPDEPIVRREAQAVPDDAFISPDAPIQRRDEPMIGTVVGMGGSVHHAGSLASIKLDSAQVSQILEETARRVRDEGIRTGLRASPDAPHFEVMLKAYLAGYFSTG